MPKAFKTYQFYPVLRSGLCILHLEQSSAVTILSYSEHGQLSVIN